MNPMLYSAVYNGGYLGGELVVSLILMYIIARKDLIRVFL